MLTRIRRATQKRNFAVHESRQLYQLSLSELGSAWSAATTRDVDKNWNLSKMVIGVKGPISAVPFLFAQNKLVLAQIKS